MAYTDFAGQIAAPRTETGSIAAFFARFFAARADRTAAPARKLAGPSPEDARAHRYLADIDMEVSL